MSHRTSSREEATKTQNPNATIRSRQHRDWLINTNEGAALKSSSIQRRCREAERAGEVRSTVLTQTNNRRVFFPLGEKVLIFKQREHGHVTKRRRLIGPGESVNPPALVNVGYTINVMSGFMPLERLLHRELPRRGNKQSFDFVLQEIRRSK